MINEKENIVSYHLEIKGVIETLLNKLSVAFDEVEILKFEDLDPKFVIKSSDSGLLIGYKGEHFKALSHLARKIVFKKTGQSKFNIDINNYQEENAKKIRDVVILLSMQVLESRKSVEMEPMSSYERMIIHTLFTADSGVVTESVGERNERRIVIKIKK